jgi:DNA recombination protein RmuC
MSAFLDAVAADDPKTREALYIKHAKELRQKVRDLKKADYAAQLEGKVDFTVMFLPGDDLLAAAFKYDPKLQEDALNSRVLIATPVTLVALLRTVGVYWKQHDLAQGAEEIQEWARELHKRVVTFVEHLAGIGKHLGQAQDSYNKTIGSYERRVRPAGQKLEQLNAVQGELPEVAEVEESVRQLSLPQ